jgi:ClpP class serine protease
MTDGSTGLSIRELSARALGGLRGLVPQRFQRDRPVVPVVRLTGIIGFSTPLRPGLTLAGLARTLDRAFTIRQGAAVALVVNSPGGSPVQSHLIFRRIRQLAEQHKRRVIAFVEDAGASGGYMIACAADEIVADQHSIVGSIGVVGGSFGLDKMIAKLGIERRLYTSGEHKAMLDPFLPENPDDVDRLKKLQREIRQACRRGRRSVLRRLLDRPAGAGTRTRRCDRRSPQRLARTIRRQARYAPGVRRTRLVWPASVRRGR